MLSISAGKKNLEKDAASQLVFSSSVNPPEAFECRKGNAVVVELSDQFENRRPAMRELGNKKSTLIR
ncbi:MAG: hypothetical protein CMJ50_06690 [Planctomycetaceae bacterium]|nr:hypothetical protein [Planctomycetaceae bacterium]